MTVNTKIIIFFFVFLHAFNIGGGSFFSLLTIAATNADEKLCLALAAFLFIHQAVYKRTHKSVNRLQIFVLNIQCTHAHSQDQCITCVNSVLSVAFVISAAALLRSPVNLDATAELLYQPFSSQIPSLSRASKSKRDLISHYHYLCYYIIFKLNVKQPCGFYTQRTTDRVYKRPLWQALCQYNNVVMGPNAIKNRFYSFNFFVYMTQKGCACFSHVSVCEFQNLFVNAVCFLIYLNRNRNIFLMLFI